MKKISLVTGIVLIFLSAFGVNLGAEHISIFQLGIGLVFLSEVL